MNGNTTEFVYNGNGERVKKVEVSSSGVIDDFGGVHVHLRRRQSPHHHQARDDPNVHLQLQWLRRPGQAGGQRRADDVHARPKCGPDASAGRWHQHVSIWQWAHCPICRHNPGLLPGRCAGQRAAVDECKRRGDSGAELSALRQCIDQRGDRCNELRLHGGVARRDWAAPFACALLRPAVGAIHLGGYVEWGLPTTADAEQMELLPLQSS